MKSILLVLGLLLVSICCCNARPKAVGYSSMPVDCCFSFSSLRLSLKRVKSISRTHSGCAKEGFIVQTVRGRQICYSQTFPWAVSVDMKLNSPEGSGHQS
ncbi:C-C motif chemokine 3-like [Sphaeramia orbicularis]|uniref:C-C motif chemokine 3-like n=1 Tax=Sphaeramia orbicularis TaxID=375764 RepID=UPI00118150D0|nr:C-C motif chemokine 3-like [Sphaeramia orbicularis]